MILARFPIKESVKSLKKKTNGKVLLIGSPLHTNLGDHLLALSELDFLNQHFPDKEVIDIPTCLYLYRHGVIAKNINCNDVVFLSGGGWLGDVWPRDEAIMQDMIATFQGKCPVFVFPQTIYYKKRNGTQFVGNRFFWNNLTAGMLALREKASFTVAKNDYGINDEKIVLLPDVGLIYQSKKIQYDKNGVDVLFCLRSDIEAVLGPKEKEELYSLAKKRGLQIQHTSTLEPNHFAYVMREEKVLNKLKEFSKAKLVITDRLHGMVFSLLAGTPCLALDNETRKVHGVYECWLKEFDLIEYCDDLLDAKEKLEVFDFDLDRERDQIIGAQEAWAEMFHKVIGRYLDDRNNQETDSLSNSSSDM